eukprot:TRINITY_DN8328_c0_g1_i1.p1 TRINITY_DN8328_c0_g1~~TRINITY_DN8328_c0_g1_i1.p1  ORF type:complete len:145 (+),score=25.75 TRINITY_DN8328_c0_g1_i1:33-467(+)
MEFEEHKRGDPVKLARVLRVFSILQIGFAVVEFVLFFLIVEDKTDLQGLVLIVAAPTTLLFAIEGFYAAYNYDGFLTTLFLFYLIVRIIVYIWEVINAVLFNLGAYFYAIPAISALLRLIYVYVTVRLMRLLNTDDLVIIKTHD